MHVLKLGLVMMTVMTECRCWWHRWQGADDDDGDDVNVLTGDVITENARSNDVATRAEEPFQVGLVFGRITIVQLLRDSAYALYWRQAE